MAKEKPEELSPVHPQYACLATIDIDIVMMSNKRTIVCNHVGMTNSEGRDARNRAYQ